MVIPYWVHTDAGIWLNTQAYKDRKDETEMQAIADECNKLFGTNYVLIRCVPYHGEGRGKFAGYNIASP